MLDFREFNWNNAVLSDSKRIVGMIAIRRPSIFYHVGTQEAVLTKRASLPTQITVLHPFNPRINEYPLACWDFNTRMFSSGYAVECEIMNGDGNRNGNGLH